MALRKKKQNEEKKDINNKANNMTIKRSFPIVGNVKSFKRNSEATIR